MSDPNTRIPTHSDLNNPSFMGVRPNPSPHMSGHVPPPPSPFARPTPSPFSATGPTWRANPAAERTAQVCAPAVASTLTDRMASFAMVGAVICALYAWLGVHAAGAVIAGYAMAGAVLGAAAAVVLAILVKLLELAIKLLVICVQIALAGGAIYLLTRWLQH